MNPGTAFQQHSRAANALQAMLAAIEWREEFTLLRIQFPSRTSPDWRVEFRIGSTPYRVTRQSVDTVLAVILSINRHRRGAPPEYQI